MIANYLFRKKLWVRALARKGEDKEGARNPIAASKEVVKKLREDESVKEAGQVGLEIITNVLEIARSALHFHKVFRGFTIGLFSMAFMSATAKFLTVIEMPVLGEHPDIIYKLSYAIFFACLAYGLIAHQYEARRLRAIRAQAAEREAKLREELARCKLAYEKEIAMLKQKVAEIELEAAQKTDFSDDKNLWQRLLGRDSD